MSPVLAQLPTLERALVAAGFPAMTAWWSAIFALFYARAYRQLVLRVGRRGGKSSSLCRIAVLEALFGEHVIPPGDLGVVAIISVNRDEAAQRLRTVKAILDALRVAYRPIDGGIELVDRPIAFKVFTATIAGVSGFTCICAICDEVAKWRDAETGANPATEVLASLRPTLAGQPNARIYLSSSPMGKFDAHAAAIDKGDTDFQLTSTAPTWVARPTLTEADCRALEPDEATFAREYGAIPFDGTASSLFTDELLLKVTRKGLPRLRGEPGATYVAATDPATRGNAWTLAIARAVEDGDAIRVQVVRVREWRAPKGGALNSDQTFAEIAEELAGYGSPTLWQDQWSYDANRAIAERHGIDLQQEPATQVSKVQTFEALRRRVVDMTAELPDVPQLRQDLCGVRKWIAKNGAFSIELERVGARHADYAPAVALVVAKVASGESSTYWVRCMQKGMAADGGAAFGSREATAPPEPEIVLQYHPPKPPLEPRARAVGMAAGRWQGCAYWTQGDPATVRSTFATEVGSSDEFRLAVWDDMARRGLITESE